MESFFGLKGLAVERQRQARIQTGVIPQPFFYEFEYKRVLTENLFVRNKFNKGTSFFMAISFSRICKDTPSECCFKHPSLSVRGDSEFSGEGIHGLCADAIQPNGELKDIIVILCPGIDHRNTFYDLPERYPSSIISYPDFLPSMVMAI